MADSPIFILACGRSGTTLLRLMLTCHPRIAIPRPSHFITELYDQFAEKSLRDPAVMAEVTDRLLTHDRVRDYGLNESALRRRIAAQSNPTLAGCFRAVFEQYAQTRGKPRWGDKTTTYGRRASLIAQLFPDSKILHIVRDGRDVALSMSRSEFQSSIMSGAIAWKSEVSAIHDACKSLTGDRYHFFQYESLLKEPEATLTEICRFLGEEYDSAMLSYPSRVDEFLDSHEQTTQARIHEPPAQDMRYIWKREMSESDRAIVELVAGDLLKRFGYELTGARIPLSMYASYYKARTRKAVPKLRRVFRYLPLRYRRPLGRAALRTRQFAHPKRLAHVFKRPHENLDVEQHIQEALDWICRAQNAGSDDGVSRSATIGRGHFDLSYPETTGYIVRTMLTAAERLSKPEYRTRAERMGRWLFKIQMKSGAIPGGTDRWNRAPAVFNTGQVMLGWNRLYEILQDDSYLTRACKAAEWLVDIQEADGDWIKGHSQCAGVDRPTYNLRVAWGLCETGKLARRDAFVSAARRYVECALRMQRSNGWFGRCCLTDARYPLTHTLAYATRGALEFGLLLQAEEIVTAAKVTADALLGAVHPDGFLAGRFDDRWHGTVSWCCMTGSAQMSIIFSKLFRHTGTTTYRDGAARINNYLMRRHDITSENPTIRGGVYGAWPVWGLYNPFSVLNWATKFLIDALIEHEQSGGSNG